MNINITISSDSSESRSIHLLTEVVECLQLEKIELNEKFLTLNSKKNNVEIQLAEQVEKCQLLETENKELEEKLAEQQGKYQTLEAEKKDFESKLTEQEGICEKLYADKASVERSYAELQKQQDEAKTRRLIEAIKSLSQLLQYSLGTSLSPKWLEYLGGIKSDIDKFITEEQTISVGCPVLCSHF